MTEIRWAVETIVVSVTTRNRTLVQSYRLGHISFTRLAQLVPAAQIPSDLIPEVVISTDENGLAYQEYWSPVYFGRPDMGDKLVLIRQYC
jgi:hypothetical protein